MDTDSMNITVPAAAAIFFLGAVVGALLTRLQWIAFKQRVLREMMEQFTGGPTVESEPYVDDSRPGPAESLVGVHNSSGIVAFPTFQRFPEQNQTEIDRILRGGSGPVGPLGENNPKGTDRRSCSDRRMPRVRYARWLTPNRAMKPH